MGRLYATTYVSRQARRGKRSGSILIDAIVGVFVLAIAASAFFFDDAGDRSRPTNRSRAIDGEQHGDAWSNTFNCSTPGI